MNNEDEPIDKRRLSNSLIESASEGDIASIRKYLKKGADIHADQEGAMRSSARNGHKETVWFLASRGADFQKALMCAAQQGEVDTTARLIEYKSKTRTVATLVAAFAYIATLKVCDIPLDDDAPPPTPKRIDSRWSRAPH